MGPMVSLMISPPRQASPACQANPGSTVIPTVPPVRPHLQGLGHTGHGVDRQLKDCREYARKHGHEVVEELQDNDISASGLKKRPSYLKLRQLMQDRAVDVVVVYSLDRLHRNMTELQEYITLSLSTNVLIASVADGGEVDIRRRSSTSGQCIGRRLAPRSMCARRSVFSFRKTRKNACLRSETESLTQ